MKFLKKLVSGGSVTTILFVMIGFIYPRIPRSFRSLVSTCFHLLTFLFICHSTAAQQSGELRRITGIVYGLQNQTLLPLGGALVAIKGTQKGVITDAEGKFSLAIDDEEAYKQVLEVSYLGMQPSSIKIGDQTSLTIYLEPSVTELEEVVITSSYGTTKIKEQLVASISGISAKDIAIEQPAVTFDELLEGQAAGVLVEVNPILGGAAKIDIRGQGSLTPLTRRAGTSTQPLIIVDGIILSEEITLDGNNFFDAGTNRLSEDILNPLARVGVQDIASFNILKDAAAVGLYGADASNGVILITTKAGREGPFSFNTSFQTGVKTAFNEFKYLNGEQYQSVLNEYYRNQGLLANVQQWDGTDTDWFNLLNQNGSFWRYELSASGSIKKWLVRTSVGYQKTNETQRENTFKKLNSSININRTFGKLNLKLRISPSVTIKNTPNTLYAYALPPTLPVRDEEGNFTPVNFYGNPLAVSKQNRSEANTSALLTSFGINYTLSDDFKISTLFGGDFSNKNQDRFFSGENGTGVFNDGRRGRRIIRDRDTRKWNWHSTINYNSSFTGPHQFDALMGLELRGDRVDFSYALGRGYDDFTSPQPIDLAEVQDRQNDISETAGRSFFSQWNYNYDKRFFFLVNFRIDQSSVFGGDNDTAYNGGLGASWNISSEEFFKSIQSIDFLRLRASYGRTGNSRIGTYTAVGLYDLSDRENGYQAGGQYANINPNVPPNPNLGWEVNKKFNIGIDVDFLGRFSLTTDFFHDNIEDMIVSREIIAESGYSSARINGASMFNQGLELSLNAEWFKNSKWKWRTSVNFTRIRNKVTSLTGLESAFSTASVARAQRVGQPTSALWGINFVGIDPATGRELFEVNGEVFDAVTIRNDFDETIWSPIGDTQPDLFGGINNTLTYGNISLQVIMSYEVGGDFFVQRSLIDNYNDLVFRNPPVEVFYDAWRSPGDVAILPVITTFNPIVNNSSKYVYDNSHLKLKSVTIKYHIPLEEHKLPLNSLDVSLNGSNLYYWFREQTPEGRNGIAELRNQYPEMRAFTLRVSAAF